MTDTQTRDTDMETVTNLGDLYADLAKAQAEMKNAAFDMTNPHYKNRYASLASVRDAVVPVLAKHGLSIVQLTQTRPAFELVTVLCHKSGGSIESFYPLAVDKPQAMGSQITYARRYCLLAIAGIAGDEDDDAEAAQKSPPKPGSTVRAAAKAPGSPAEASGSAETDKPAWTGDLNKTALTAHSRRIVDELNQISDEGALAGFWSNKEMQSVLKLMRSNLPEFYDAVCDAKDLAKERCHDEEERKAIAGEQSALDAG